MSLELRNIHKHFGPVRANDGIDLSVAAGELHGLLGENGAGKSTLMKVLSGYHRADSGEILVDGTPVTIADPGDAIRHGIGMLHQDPLVFLPFTVTENFILGSPKRVDRRTARRELREMSERFGFTFDINAPARTLTVGERQQLEIVRLLWLGARVLILDEPTTGISTSQRLKLFATLRTLADEGMIVIFVSHKLEEVEELCHRVTVMRRGKVVGKAEMPVAPEALVQMMFGQEVTPSARPAVDLGPARLEVDGIGAATGLLSEEPVSLIARTGEVIGLAGMEGSGQRAFLRMCAGLRRPHLGTISVDGARVSGNPYRAFLDAGVKFLPAGRLEEGLIQGLTIAEHFVLASGEAPFFVDWDAAAETAAAHIGEYTIKGTATSPAEALSGGNQQRLLLAMLPPQVKVLLMEHPTRGLDIESADWVWEQLLGRRADGTTIVFASADLDELLRYSDRIVVFFAGKVLEVLDAATTSVEEIGSLIGGRRRRGAEEAS